MDPTEKGSGGRRASTREHRLPLQARRLAAALFVIRAVDRAPRKVDRARWGRSPKVLRLIEHKVVPLLLVRKRAADVGALYPDPVATLRGKHMHREAMKGSRMPEEMKQRIVSFAENNFRTEAATLRACLVAANRRSEAQAVAEAAMRLDPEEAMAAMLRASAPNVASPTEPREVPAEVLGAANAAARAEAAKAGDLLTPYLTGANPRADALLIAACVELETGNLATARSLIEQLHAAAPAAAEDPLLLAVAERREHRSSEGWIDSISSALATVKPDSSPPVFAADTSTSTPEFPSPASLSLPGDDGFVLRAYTGHSSIEPQLLAEAKEVAAATPSLGVAPIEQPSWLWSGWRSLTRPMPTWVDGRWCRTRCPMRR